MATALNTTQLSGHRHARLGGERHKGGRGAKAKHEDGQGFEDCHGFGLVLAAKYAPRASWHKKGWGKKTKLPSAPMLHCRITHYHKTQQQQKKNAS